MNVQALFVAPPALADPKPADGNRASSPAPSAQTQAQPVRAPAMRLTNAKCGGQLSIVRVAGAAPAMLAYLAEVGLAAETRITVRNHRANSAVMTIRIQGHRQDVHLGSMASDALWVEMAA